MYKLLQNQSGYLRLDQILGNPKYNYPPLIPVGKSTWWAGVKSGRFPKPTKLSERVTAWRVEDIQELMEKEFSDNQPKERRKKKSCKKKMSSES